MRSGLNFNGKHSYDDYKLYLESKSIQSPGKKKIKLDVPFMNSFYDFSTIGSNGEIIYTERSIIVILVLPTKNKKQLYFLYSKVLEWLVDVRQSKLIFDDIKDYYFLAEVEGVSSFEEIFTSGKLTVTFTCEPFKVGVDYATNSLWDTFNFLEDYLQDSDYDVVTSKSITLYNPGRLVMPTITCSASMSITVNTVVYNLVIGDNKLYGLKLNTGANNITINGNGHIKFLFRKEVL